MLNRSLEVGEPPSGMKLANVTPVHKKKVADVIKVIIGLLAFCPIYQKSLKDIYTSKFLIFLIQFSQNINTVSGKEMVGSTA